LCYIKGMKWLLIFMLASTEYDSGIESQFMTVKFDTEQQCLQHIVEEKDVATKYRLQSFCMLEDEFIQKLKY